MKQQLTELLLESMLFEAEEVEEIIATCGAYTLGNAIIACELLKISLIGNDIDILISLQSK